MLVSLVTNEDNVSLEELIKRNKYTKKYIATKVLGISVQWFSILLKEERLNIGQLKLIYAELGYRFSFLIEKNKK